MHSGRRRCLQLSPARATGGSACCSRAGAVASPSDKWVSPRAPFLQIASFIGELTTPPHARNETGTKRKHRPLEFERTQTPANTTSMAGANNVAHLVLGAPILISSPHVIFDVLEKFPVVPKSLDRMRSSSIEYGTTASMLMPQNADFFAVATQGVIHRRADRGCRVPRCRRARLDDGCCAPFEISRSIFCQAHASKRRRGRRRRRRLGPVEDGEGIVQNRDIPRPVMRARRLRLGCGLSSNSAQPLERRPAPSWRARGRDHRLCPGVDASSSWKSSCANTTTARPRSSLCGFS